MGSQKAAKRNNGSHSFTAFVQTMCTHKQQAISTNLYPNVRFGQTTNYLCFKVVETPTSHMETLHELNISKAIFETL